jgi:protein-tyrosine phosphatase
MGTEIRLLTPYSGEITPPLQLCRWQEYRHQYENGSTPSVNRGFAAAVHLVWEPSNGLSLGDRRYDVILATEPGLENGRSWKRLAQCFLDLHDLQLGTRYFWKVIEYKRRKVTAESAVGWFETHPSPPRWLSAHGISNLRDAGGWSAGPGKRIRQGLIYRSVEINNHYPLSSAGRRYLLEDLGVRTDLDLRGGEERPTPALDTNRVTYINAPVDAYDQITVPWSQDGFRLAFETLAQAERYPILVHCWGGADRTGTLIFLLNGLLGVSPDDLYHDYELTSLSGVGKRLTTSIQFQKMLDVLRSCAPKDAPLTQQIEGYLTQIGVTTQQIAALQAQLIETSG